MYAHEADLFESNCRALAAAARACGAELHKLPDHAVAIEVCGESIAFPVASDDRDWELTTPEEAFYAAMLDAEAFTAVTPGENVTPQFESDRDGAAERVSTLAGLLGGTTALADVLAAGGLRGEEETRFSR